MYNEESNYYCVIPANILYSQDLSSSEKILFLTISNSVDKNKHCNKNNKYFADKLNKSLRQIQTYLANLKKLEIIEIEFIGNNRIIKLKNMIK